MPVKKEVCWPMGEDAERRGRGGREEIQGGTRGIEEDKVTGSYNDGLILNLIST